MGSTDSLDSGKDSAVDEFSPRHDGQRPPPPDPVAVATYHGQAFADGGVRRRRLRRRGDDKCSTVGMAAVPPPSPPPVAVREHHNRSKSADCSGGGGDGDSDGTRKTHAKSLSVGDDSFDHKIRMWRKRADSQGSIDRPKPTSVSRHHQYADLKGSGGAPDLVMDLPVRSSGDRGGPSTAVASMQEPDSPDMGTAAERFAKQNQCTLKKYSKPLPPLPSALQQQQQQHTNDKPQLPPKSSAKPPLKAKPRIFRKPVFLASSTSSSIAASVTSTSSSPPVSTVCQSSATSAVCKNNDESTSQPQ